MASRSGLRAIMRSNCLLAMISRILLPTSASLAAFGAAATASCAATGFDGAAAGRVTRSGTGAGTGAATGAVTGRGAGSGVGATLATGASCAAAGAAWTTGSGVASARAGLVSVLVTAGVSMRVAAAGARALPPVRGALRWRPAPAALRIRGASPAHRPRPATGRGNGCRCRSDRPSTTAWACCPACCSRARPDCGAWNRSGFCGAAEAVVEAVRISASAVPARKPSRMLSRLRCMLRVLHSIGPRS